MCGFRGLNPAPDESLFEEQGQVEGGKRRYVYGLGGKPASHFLIVAEIFWNIHPVMAVVICRGIENEN